MELENSRKKKDEAAREIKEWEKNVPVTETKNNNESKMTEVRKGKISEAKVGGIISVMNNWLETRQGMKGIYN